MGEVYRARDTKLDRDVALKGTGPRPRRDPPSRVLARELPCVLRGRTRRRPPFPSNAAIAITFAPSYPNIGPPRIWNRRGSSRVRPAFHPHADHRPPDTSGRRTTLQTSCASGSLATAAHRSANSSTSPRTGLAKSRPEPPVSSRRPRIRARGTGSRLNETTTDSRAGQRGVGMALALLVACWTSWYAPARVAKPSIEEPDAEEPARPDLWGAGVSNDPGLPDRLLVSSVPSDA